MAAAYTIDSGAPAATESGGAVSAVVARAT